jgi:hypothetical protein
MKKPRSPAHAKKLNERANRLLTNLVNRCLRVGQPLAPTHSVVKQIITGAVELHDSGKITKAEYTDVVAAAKHIRKTAEEAST